MIMRKKFFQGLLIILCSMAYSQKIIVMDSLNKKPISFVKIQTSKDAGLYSDENGFFDLNKDVSDTLYLSHNLYPDFAIATKNIKDTIFLINKASLIDEIVLTKKEKTLINIDFLKRPFHYPDYPLTSNTELLSLVIPNPRISNLRIREIKFAFRKKTYFDRDAATDSKPVIRINLYYLDQDNKKEKLYSSEAFVIDKSKKNFISVDLSNKRILLYENGLYVGIESIGNINQDGRLTNEKITVRPLLTEKKSIDYSITTYYKNTFNGIEAMTPINDSLLEMTGEKSIHRQLSFGMTLLK